VPLLSACLHPFTPAPHTCRQRRACTHIRTQAGPTWWRVACPPVLSAAWPYRLGPAGPPHMRPCSGMRHPFMILVLQLPCNLCACRWWFVRRAFPKRCSMYVRGMRLPSPLQCSCAQFLALSVRACTGLTQRHNSTTKLAGPTQTLRGPSCRTEPRRVGLAAAAYYYPAWASFLCALSRRRRLTIQSVPLWREGACLLCGCQYKPDSDLALAARSCACTCGLLAATRRALVRTHASNAPLLLQEAAVGGSACWLQATAAAITRMLDASAIHHPMPGRAQSQSQTPHTKLLVADTRRCHRPPVTDDCRAAAAGISMFTHPAAFILLHVLRAFMQRDVTSRI
jgi:hypothetical protein